MPPELTVGWDVGGAHVKAALLAAPNDGPATMADVVDVAQWPCPLWQGLDRLQPVLVAAHARWPQALAPSGATHAVTMTGEMVDHFEHREAGVRALVDVLATSIAPTLRIFCGEAGWCTAAEAGGRWADIASANWWATAAVAAQRLHGRDPQAGAVLVDVGSTTTDLVALRAGRVCATGRSDAQRLVRGELLYQGVVRTPLCAMAPRIAHRGERYNVMNECFATTADVYRLSGELDAAHDQHPTADGAPKDAAATRQRLARMIGLDARDAAVDDWLAFAQAWRAAQLATLRDDFERVAEAARLGPRAAIVGAGCGDFLAERLAAETGRPYLRFGSLWRVDAAVSARALADPIDPQAVRRRLQVGAPAASVGWLCASGWKGGGPPAADGGGR